MQKSIEIPFCLGGEHVFYYDSDDIQQVLLITRYRYLEQEIISLRRFERYHEVNIKLGKLIDKKKNLETEIREMYALKTQLRKSDGN